LERLARTAAHDRGEEFLRALEKASGAIRDPVAKLRFIRSSLQRYQSLDRVVRLIPIPGLRGFLYRWLSLEGIRPLLVRNTLGEPEPVARHLRLSLLATRAGAAGIVVLAACAVGGTAWQLTRPAVAAPAPVGPAVSRPAAVAEALAPLPAGLQPARVWLVERGADYEQYSNGLRIETGWAITGDARRYRVFDARGGLAAGTRERPAGLLFHTTESDIWPLEAEFNEKLRDSSERLLRYLQRNRTYHYLVDRFGRVFRVVDEGSKANHAGNSIWEHDGTVFLNLNHAFLGVSFESRWGGGQSLPITQAQLVAGRNLTDYLRQRFELAPQMCVAHGLTSVNPKKHRIGHHMDWSRGFPWAAFGLPDQYAREAPSVALFGFGYDDDFLKVLPEPWAGVRTAEARLAREADEAGRSVEELRRERQQTYDRWAAEQAQADRKGVSGVDQAS
jgi:hypothetical protein